MSLKIRAIENVEYMGRLAGAMPQLTHFLLQNRLTVRLIKNVSGLDHKKRKNQSFAKESFAAWLRSPPHKHIRPSFKDKKKVAYFASRTPRYFFPEIPKAFVDIFE